MPQVATNDRNGPGPTAALRWTVIAVEALAGLVLWCLLDVIHVRYSAARSREYDQLLLLFPVVLFVCNVVIIRKGNGSRRILRALGMSILATAITVMLVLFLGVAFHHLIGGKL